MKTRLFLTLLGALAVGAVGLSGAAVAQGQGGGGGGRGGGGGATAPDYGDLIILYRDEYGVPYPSASQPVPDPETGLDVPGGRCWQPIADTDFSYFGWDPPVDRVVEPIESTPVDGGWLIPVDQYNCAVEGFFATHTQEVEFGRTNEARSPVTVFEAQLEDVVIKLATADSTSLDPAGRMVASTCGEGEDTISSTIDSPLQNLAVYRQLMLTGFIGTDLPEDADLLDTAARGLGVAADKGGAVSVDMVAYINMLMGLDQVPTMLSKRTETYREEVQGEMQTVTRQFLNYSTFEYDRGANFGALPSPKYIPLTNPVDGWFEYMVAVDNTTPSFTIAQGPIMQAVFCIDANGDPVLPDANGVCTAFIDPGFQDGNIGGFAQAADDTRAVINFMHDWPIPDADVYGTPVPCTPNPGLITVEVSISSVSGLQVPKNIIDGSSDREFIVTVANAGPDDATVTLTVTATPAVDGDVQADLGAGFIPSPFVFPETVIEAGSNHAFSALISVQIGAKTTIDWEATASTAETDVNPANNFVTGLSNVKVTSGGGGH